MAIKTDLHFSLQNVSTIADIPSHHDFQTWVELALQDRCAQAEITVRIVDPKESQHLNSTYRHKSKPTNVLAFPLTREPLLGDLVICAAIVIEEAQEQHKPVRAHWAHLTIHGVLHLLDYDHIEENEAKRMESLEITLLDQLGFANPYGV